MLSLEGHHFVLLGSSTRSSKSSSEGLWMVSVKVSFGIPFFLCGFPSLPNAFFSSCSYSTMKVLKQLANLAPTSLSLVLLCVIWCAPFVVPPLSLSTYSFNLSLRSWLLTLLSFILSLFHRTRWCL